jgi:hypothetical protein
MKTGTRVGIALTAGYVLGRLHKMKWALAVAAFASRGRLPSGPGGLVQQGAKLLTSSPELTKLTDEMKGRLVDAGKAAAVAAVSNKINSLSEGLRERSEAMRAQGAGGNGGAAAGEEEEVEEERYRDEDRRRDEEERYRDEDRAAQSRARRHRDEDIESRDQAERVPAPRRESDRARASRESRSREHPAADDRGGHPSRQDVEGNGPRSEPAGRGSRGDGRSRPRSTTSRTGGDSE